jgi:hypothetical protein
MERIWSGYRADMHGWQELNVIAAVETADPPAVPDGLTVSESTTPFAEEKLVA